MAGARRYFSALDGLSPGAGTMTAYYEAAWHMRAQVVESWMAAGELSLPRLLSRFQTYQERYSLGVDKRGGRLTGWLEWQEVDPDWSWRGLRKLESGKRGILRGDDCAMPPYVQFNMAEMLVDFADDVDTIVELGSGYGGQLFRLFLAGGPGDARYVGAEISPAGRDLAEKLAQLQPGLRFENHVFDLNDPDWSCLNGSRRALIFSSWSLMYPQSLPDDFFLGLSRWPGSATLVFCEPLGFQWGASHPVSDAQKNLAATGLINGNLADLVGAATAQGLIEPLLVAKDLFSRNRDEAPDLMSVLVYAKAES